MTPAQLLKADNIGDYYTYEPILDENKRVVVEPFISMTESHAKTMSAAGIKSANFAVVPNKESYIINCLARDPSKNTDDALKEIYKRMRQGDPSPSTETARALLQHLFFDNERYDLGLVGRYKINEHLNLDIDENCRILTKEDIIEATPLPSSYRHPALQAACSRIFLLSLMPIIPSPQPRLKKLSLTGLRSLLSIRTLMLHACQMKANP